MKCAVRIILLLILSLAVTVGVAHGISISIGNAESANYFSSAAWEGKLILYDSANYRYSVISVGGSELCDMPSLTILEEADGEALYRSALTLVSDGDTVFAVEMTVRSEDGENHFEAAELYRLNPSIAARERLLELDLRDMIYQAGTGEACAACRDALMADGQLFLLYEDPDTISSQGFALSGAQTLLLRFDLANGKKQRYVLDNCISLLAFREDALLIARENGAETEIVRLNLNGGAEKVFERIAAAPITAMAVSPDLNVLYYATDNRLWGMKRGTEPKMIGSLPFYDVQGLALLDEHTLAAHSQDRALILSIDWNYEPSANRLTIAGDMALIEGFAALHPEIDVQAYDTGTMSLTDVLLTQSAQPDVFILDTYHESYRQYRDRGYLLPLKSAKLQDFVARLHPDIAAAATGADGFCALPIKIQPQAFFGFNEAIWDDAVLGAPPESWTELLDFFERWPELSRSASAPQLMNYTEGAESLHSLLLGRLISAYDVWRGEQAEAVDYDTELFRTLAARLNELDYETLCERSYGGDARTLMMVNCLPSLTFDYGFTPLPLHLAPESAPHMNAIVRFAAINPYSENIEAATAFLEYCADTIDPIDRIEMMPGENAPLRSETYAEDLALLAERVEALEQRIAQCSEPADLSLLQAELEACRKSLADAETTWRVDTESIAAYRALSERIEVLYRQELSDEERMSLYYLRMNFIQGDMKLDDFVQQMNRRILMRELEDQ